MRRPLASRLVSLASPTTASSSISIASVIPRRARPRCAVVQIEPFRRGDETILHHGSSARRSHVAPDSRELLRVVRQRLPEVVDPVDAARLHDVVVHGPHFRRCIAIFDQRDKCHAASSRITCRYSKRMKLRGSCHCGAVRFSLESKTPYPYMWCYCSICRKTAGGGGYAINIMGEARTLKVTGRRHLAAYRAKLPADGKTVHSPARATWQRGRTGSTPSPPRRHPATQAERAPAHLPESRPRWAFPEVRNSRPIPGKGSSTGIRAGDC